MNRTILKFKREVISALSKVFLKKVRTNYLGMPLTVPIVYGLKNGGYIVPDERWMGDCLKSFVDTKAGTVLDIGVNVGVYLVKLRVISKDIDYIGFEPNPSCLLYTHELIRLNKFKNAKIIPVALAENETITKFYASKIGDKRGSLIKEHLKDETLAFSFDTLVMKGDDLIARLDIDKIAAIKVDVEEAEIYVLRGILDTLKKYRPYVYCEILDVLDDVERTQRKDDICSLFTGIDYAIFGISLKTNSLEQIKDASEVGVSYLAEYIFVPTENIGVFIKSIKNNSCNIKIN